MEDSREGHQDQRGEGGESAGGIEMQMGEGEGGTLDSEGGETVWMEYVVVELERKPGVTEVGVGVGARLGAGRETIGFMLTG